MSARVLSAIAFSTALALAPVVANAYWHGRYYHGGGAGIGAAIAGGLLGFGLGAAAAANGYHYYYAPPPPVYYGYPYSYYYAPPPGVYFNF